MSEPKIPADMSIKDVLEELIEDVDLTEIVSILDIIVCEDKCGRILWVKEFVYPDAFNPRRL